MVRLILGTKLLHRDWWWLSELGICQPKWATVSLSVLVTPQLIIHLCRVPQSLTSIEWAYSTTLIIEKIVKNGQTGRINVRVVMMVEL